MRLPEKLIQEAMRKFKAAVPELFKTFENALRTSDWDVADACNITYSTVLTSAYEHRIGKCGDCTYVDVPSCHLPAGHVGPHKSINTWDNPISPVIIVEDTLNIE